MRRLLSMALLALGVLAGGLATGAAGAQEVRVAAAASLSNVLDEIGALWRQQGRGTMVGSYAASSTLAKQIEAGAPFDVFISADLDWMDHVAQRNLIDPASRRNLTANALVLIAPAASQAALRLEPGADLASALGAGGRLAVGDPGGVPAGRYAQAALTRLGLWPQVAARLAPAESVRAALALVARGEAPLGIVYSTDAKAEPRVRVVAAFPGDSHPPIVYPMARLAGSGNAAAGEFLAFLLSPPAQAVFERAGFVTAP